MTRSGWRRALTRWALLAYPRRFRRRHGAHLADLVDDLCSREERSPGPLLLETLVQGLAARVDELRRRNRRSLPSPGDSSLMDRLLQDLRFALRGLRAQPGYTLVVALTLGLGIGANTAIFSVINAVALRPLPVPDAGRVFALSGTNDARGLDDVNLSLPDLRDLVQGSERVARGGGFATRSRNLTLGEYPERVATALVADDLLSVLGMRRLAGRLLTEEDGLPGAPPVALVAEGLWRARLGADPRIVGTSLRIDGVDHRVVGVVSDLPASRVSLLEPVSAENAGRRRNRFLQAYVRLEVDAAPEAAQAEMDAVAASLAAELPESNRDWRFRMIPLRTALHGEFWAPLSLLLGAVVGAVLLVACSNVANLTLARAATRSRDLAIRAALGADRSRLTRQLLVESLALSALAGCLGIVIGAVGAALLRAHAVADLPAATAPHVDGDVLLFTLGASLATGLAFGLLPALRASRPDLSVALGQGGTTIAGSRVDGRARTVLVVAQVCTAVVLLATAGLLLSSLARALLRDVGFDADGVLTMRLDLPSERYPVASVTPFVDELLDRIGTLPGVRMAAATSQLPMDSNRTARSFKRPEEPDPALDEARWATWVSATPGYLEAVGARVVEGRTLTTGDDAAAEPVAVVNRAMARELFGQEPAVGHSVLIWSDEAAPRRIVGVVDDLTDRPFGDASFPQYFVPLAQGPRRGLSLVLRLEDQAADTLVGVRRLLKQRDPDLPVYDVRPLEDVVAARSAARRVLAALIAGFAALALGLAALGLYGSISQTVTGRTREMGVRIAMGAEASRLRWLVVAWALRLSATGVLLGLPLGLIATGLTRSRLPGAGTVPIAGYGLILLVVLGVTLLAAYLPARRATRVDPVSVLRAE